MKTHPLTRIWFGLGCFLLVLVLSLRTIPVDLEAVLQNCTTPPWTISQSSWECGSSLPSSLGSRHDWRTESSNAVRWNPQSVLPLSTRDGARLDRHDAFQL